MVKWKAVIIGILISIALGIVLGIIYSLLGLIGWLLGGLVGCWVGKAKNRREGAEIGLLSGFIGTSLLGIFQLVAFNFYSIAINTPTNMAEIALLGVLINIITGTILGLIGGVIGSSIVKKK